MGNFDLKDKTDVVVSFTTPDLERSPSKRSVIWRFGKRSKKFWLLAAILGFLTILVAAAGIGWQSYNAALLPVSNSGSRVKFVVSSGQTADIIGAELQKKGLIKSSLAFQIYVKNSGDINRLQAGIYLLKPNQSVKEIVNWLVAGKTSTFNLTILPGQNLKQIKEVLIKNEFAAADIDAAFGKKYDHKLLADKPDAVGLEGYIYPETYQLDADVTVEQLLVKTFDELYAKLQANDLQAKLKVRGFNIHQALTLASIIQKETSLPADQPQVAQVFEKRLAVNMQLGSDVTFIYAASLLGVEPTVNIDSPYNTRRYAGLPPGPIANFNLSALQAVADPAAGDYLFFVAGDDGKTYFAKTELEHKANIDKYCTTLCQ